MIFGIGLTMFFIGSFIMSAFGTRNMYQHNAADYVGGIMFISGFLCMLGSLCVFLSRWLP